VWCVVVGWCGGHYELTFCKYHKCLYKLNLTMYYLCLVNIIQNKMLNVKKNLEKIKKTPQ